MAGKMVGSGREISRDSIRSIILAFPSVIYAVASSGAEEAITVMLDCKTSMTKYRNGMFMWPDTSPQYYRLTAHQPVR
jgi:hypothetical protein